MDDLWVRMPKLAESTPMDDQTTTRPAGSQGTDRHVEDVVRFLQAVFAPSDYILIRPIETWTQNGQKKSRVDHKGIQCIQAGDNVDNVIQRHNERSKVTKCNIFFGVCPRFGSRGQYGFAWQIRIVRVLWADVDHCTVDEAVGRCNAAGLPKPSIVVASGNGAHLYWILAEPYLIDDVGDPPPVFTDFIDQGDGKQKKTRKYLQGTDGAKVYIDGKDKHNTPALSLKARHIQDILAGIAFEIGGDHTTDLSRLLRMPGTLNRKDQRNGREPVPCMLAQCDPHRRYSIDEFAKYAEALPDPARRAMVDKVKLPAPRKLSSPRLDQFQERLLICDTADVGARSEADFALCCWAVEHGVPREWAWREAQNVGKFHEAGQRYFDRTWEKAEQHTRQKLFDKAKAMTQKKSNPSAVVTSPETHLTDVGNAQRLVAKYGHILRYCWTWGKWLAWDSRRWRIDEGGHAQRLAKQTVLSMYSEAAKLPDHERSRIDRTCSTVRKSVAHQCDDRIGAAASPESRCCRATSTPTSGC